MRSLPTAWGVLGSAVLIAGVLTRPAPAAQEEAASGMEMARQLNEAFVQLADEVSRSVVVIDVAGGGGGQTNLEDLPFFEELPEEQQEKFREEQEESQPEREGPPQYQGKGSGVIYREDGYILTNRHVVENAEAIRVRLRDGREFDGEAAVIHGEDPQSDLAMIKIDADGLTPAKWGDSSQSRVGEFVVAIGAPFNLDYSVTVGHVSAKGRSRVIPTWAGGAEMDQNFIQTDANINPGNSGGPLVNLEGEVIGINTIIKGLRTGIGFAIASNLAKEVADELIAEGKYTRAWLGIQIRSLSEDREVRGRVEETDQGVVVRGVLRGGPAAKSDLSPFDVIVSVDGEPVADAQELKAAVRGKPIGRPMTVGVIREGRRVDLEVVPEAWPEEQLAQRGRFSSPDSTGERASMGIAVRGLNGEQARERDMEENEGVLVTKVEAESPAQLKGIRPGDVITEVDHQRVTTPEEFHKAMGAANPEAGVVVIVVSEGTQEFLVLREIGD